MNAPLGRTPEKKRAYMSAKVRRGLDALAEYARCWLEADGWETPDKKEADEMLAAFAYLGVTEFEGEEDLGHE